MSLRIDSKLKSPAPEAQAPSNMRKPELRGEVRSHAKSKHPHAAPTKKSNNQVEHQQVEHQDDYKAEKKPSNALHQVQAPKNNPIKDSTKEIEVDDDLLFSAELEKQMEGADIALVDGMQEIQVSPKQAFTALSALAGLAAAQEQVPNTKVPVEVVFNNAPEKLLAKTQNSDLQAMLTGDAQMNVEMPQTDASLYSADKLLKTTEGEAIDVTGKVKLTKEVNQPQVAEQVSDNENVINLLNQKRNIKNPAQGQYANQNPKLILEKVMKEVKAKTGNMEVTPEEIKMMKNLDYLNDADKVVKFIGGEKDLDSQSNMSTKATDKVFDLSKIKTTNTNEIINQISDYIIQNQTAKKSNVELAVNHNDLGRINIHVQKLNPEQVNIQIMTQTPEGKQFFAENSRGLLNHLSTNGVHVADLKLDNTASSNLNSGKDQSGSSEQHFTGGRGQHAHNQSEDNNRRQDSRRREELWENYRRNAA